MFALKSINYNTRHCTFSIDSESDLEFLPTQTHSGKGTLKPIMSCNMGSIAECTDGSKYTLVGKTDKWTLYEDKSTPSAMITGVPLEKIETLFN